MTLNVGLLVCFYGNYCIVKYDILQYYGFRDMENHTHTFPEFP